MDSASLMFFKWSNFVLLTLMRYHWVLKFTFLALTNKTYKHHFIVDLVIIQRFLENINIVDIPNNAIACWQLQTRLQWHFLKTSLISNKEVNTIYINGFIWGSKYGLLLCKEVLFMFHVKMWGISNVYVDEMLYMMSLLDYFIYCVYQWVCTISVPVLSS